MPRFIDETGAQQEVTLDGYIFREAKEANLTVRQLINNKYKTSSDTEVFKQMCASEQLFFNSDDAAAYGVNSTPLSQILDPPLLKEGAANTTRENPVQSRILFPPALMSVVEDAMQHDRGSAVTVFDQMTAITTTVSGARTVQPVISYTGKSGPEDTRAQQIAQLSLPLNMMTITATERAKTIPTFSVGLAVSDEAMQYTTLDLVGLALTRQKEIEMFMLAGEAMLDILNGNVDSGQGALPQVKADTLDPLVVAQSTISHLAWMKWLHTNNIVRRMDYTIVDSLETAMAIENRAGKPIVTSDDPNSPRIDAVFDIIYPNIQKNMKIFISPEEWSMPADTMMGFQSSAAIAKLVNSNASYEASERWALRKGEAMRFDFGQTYYRLYDEAFSVLSLTTT